MKTRQQTNHVKSRSALLVAAISALLVGSATQADTIGLYRFENGAPGPVPAPGYNDPADRTVLDSSGRGNHFQSFHHGFYPGGPNDFTVSPAYQTDLPAPTVPGLGNVANTRSLSFSNRPGQENNYDLYQVSPDLNARNFSQLTLEATVKFDFTGSFQTFVGKDGVNYPNSFGGLSSLYFQLTQLQGHENEFAIATHQADGQFVTAFSVRKVVPGVWYNVAGVADGSSLRLYMKQSNETNYTAGPAVPFVGQMATQDRVWTLGRGMFNNQLADYFRGGLDEVRISDAALSPTQFLFPGLVARPDPKAPVTVPSPRLQYGMNGNGANGGTLGSAFDGQSAGVAGFVAGAGAAAVGNGALRLGTNQGDDARFTLPQVDVGDPANDGDFTFSAWVRAGASSALQMIVVNANTFPFAGYKFYVSPDRSLHIELGNGGGVGGFGTNAGALPDDGKFHHVSFTFDRSGDAFINSYARLFVDGTDLTTGGAPQAGVLTNAGITMGQQYPNSVEPFGLVGSIDQAEFYGGQLSADQLKLLGAARWAENAGGSWTQSNFHGGTTDGAGAAVRFGDRITSAQTVTLDAARTVGYLIFDTAAPVTIAGPSSLTLDGGNDGVVVQTTAGNHVVTAPVVANGGTTFDIAAGSSLNLLLGGITSADATVKLVKSGAGTLAAQSISGGMVSVADGKLSLPSSTRTVSTLDGLAIANDGAPLGSRAYSAQLDVGTSDVIVRNGNIAALTDMARAGQNGSTLFAGNGITSSVAAADANGQLRYAVGVVQNNINGTAIYDTFEGVAVSTTDTLVKFTYFGDADLNGFVDDTDFFLVNNGYLNGLNGWINGDFDYSGVVDDTDFFLINNGYLNQGAALRAGSGVPEPTGMGLMALAAGALVGRRRR